MTPSENDPGDLRRAAEKRLKESSVSDKLLSQAELQRLQHELQVYRVELEIQNEELSSAMAELEVSLKRYVDLFESAPVGYFNLNSEGVILDVNPAGTRLVGLEFHRLKGSKFGLLLAEADRSLFAEILTDVLATGVSHSGDLTIMTEGGEKKFIRLEASGSSFSDVCQVVLLDLTERKQVEDKLRLSDLALKAISEGVVITAADKKIRWVNQGFELMTGYSWAEWQGKTCLQIQGALTDPKTIAEIRQAIRNGAEFHGEILNYRKNKETFWNELSISPIHDERGELSHFIGVVRDITSRKQIQQEKQVIDERLRFALKASNVGLWNWDIRTNTVYFSPEWKSQLGYSDHEIENRHEEWASRVHPEEFPLVLEHREKYLAGKITTYDVEFRMRHKDGSWRWINARGDVRYDGSGNQIGMLGCHIDITEQKSAVESLQLMKFCVDHTADPVYWVSREGSIQYINDACSVQLGYSRDELLRMSIWDLDVVPDYQPGRWEKHFDEIKIQGNIILETRHRAKNGREFPIEVSANYVKIGNRELNFAFTRDISERKQAEDERRKLQEQMLHAQKLEGLGVMASGIAHDFNNLLTAMLGNASLARMQLPKESRVGSFLDEIESAAKSAAKLTSQMLAYSGKGRFDISPLRIDSLVSETIQLLKTVVSKKVKICPKLDPAACEGDVSQVQQVIMNLITNASDAFQGEAGEVYVRTGLRRFDSASLYSPYVADQIPPGEYVFIEVEDNGCGMSKETLAKIFDPFFSTKMTGRGLGLAAVLGIIRSHRGTIKVASELGLGTTFEVLLPAIETIVPQDSIAADKVNSIGNRTILIVDDEEFVRRFLSSCVETAGFSVLTAADGCKGLDAFRQHSAKISLVLLDLTMPRKGGLEVLKELREQSLDLPVLIMSGYSEHEISLQKGGAGPCEFIQKPFSPDELISRINSLLASNH